VRCNLNYKVLPFTLSQTGVHNTNQSSTNEQLILLPTSKAKPSYQNFMTSSVADLVECGKSQAPLTHATQKIKIKSNKNWGFHNYFENWELGFWVPVPIAHCSMLSREPKPPANSSSTTESTRPASLSVTSSSSSFPVAQCVVPPSADLFSPSATAAGMRSGRTKAAERTIARR
jgi:hypothetical protein